MDNPYLNDTSALSWLEFMTSADGAIFRQVLGDAMASRFEAGKTLNILDAGCGSGWLAKRLAELGHSVQGCDVSPILINFAKTNQPKITFTVADLNSPLPFNEGCFDAVTLCMAGIDLTSQEEAAKNLFRVLKNNGRLLIITTNPYYTYPVGVWKRGLMGRLTGQKPRLKLRPYEFYAKDKNRRFNWNNGLLASNFYTLPEQINPLLAAGFNLKFIKDISSPSDSPAYDLTYRLYRFPVFLLLELVKG